MKVMKLKRLIHLNKKNIKMSKRIRRIGTSHYIGLKPVDMTDKDIDSADEVEIEDIKIIKNKQKKVKKK